MTVCVIIHEYFMTLNRILTFQDDRVHVYLEDKKGSTNYKDHGIHLPFAGYAFFDKNRAEIYDEGHSRIDPSNPDFSEQRHAIIG